MWVSVIPAARLSGKQSSGFPVYGRIMGKLENYSQEGIQWPGNVLYSVSLVHV